MSKQANKQTNKKEAKRNEVVASLDLLSGAISRRENIAILAEARTFHSRSRSSAQLHTTSSHPLTTGVQDGRATNPPLSYHQLNLRGPPVRSLTVPVIPDRDARLQWIYGHGDELGARAARTVVGGIHENLVEDFDERRSRS